MVPGTDFTKLRESVYLLVAPIGALLIFYGAFSENEVQLWSVLIGAILTAATNVFAGAMIHVQRRDGSLESRANVDQPRSVD